MSASVLPFLEYLILQFFVAAVGFNVINEREIGISGCVKCWLFGQMLCFAVLQFLAVPMILMRLEFNVLFWSYCGICIALFSLGVWRLIKQNIKIRIRMPEMKPLELLLLTITILLILWQTCNYFFGMHLDEDDARWLAEANDALYTGDMMTRSFDTGEYVGAFVMDEDVSSPWPMLFAVLSRVLFNTRVSIVAHTIYPTVEIILVYSIYWLIGKQLFDKRISQLSFVFTTTVVMLFYGVTVYSQGTFTLIRIWQGKATVAGVTIPLLLYIFICINKGNKTSDWLKTGIVGVASCLMSGMGIIISYVMISVYGFYNIIAYQNWKRIIPWIGTLIPSVAYLLINYFLRG